MCYHQTPFNVALIVEQLSTNDVDLTEKKMNMIIDEQNKQWNVSENNDVNQTMRAEAK